MGSLFSNPSGFSSAQNAATPANNRKQKVVVKAARANPMQRPNNNAIAVQPRCLCCNKPLFPHNGFVLKECRHTFCRLCLVNHIFHSFDSFGQVGCPHSKKPCRGIIMMEEIVELLGTDYDKFTLKVVQLKESLEPPYDFRVKRPRNNNVLHEGQKFMKLMPQIDDGRKVRQPPIVEIKTERHCFTPGCIGVVKTDIAAKEFCCTRCLVVNCINCLAIHEGKTCQQFRDVTITTSEKLQHEDAETEKYIRGMIESKEAMQCPKCGILVTKDDGCAFVTCAVCQLEICFITQKPRHPLELADGRIIDGCHCKENGQKCHPECGNCH